MIELMIDHVLILHDDLEMGAEAAARLGFCPTPTGHHGQGMGTANTTLMMPDRETYVEILTVVEATEKSAPMRAALAARGGAHVFGVALKGDAQQAAQHFEAEGIGGGPWFGFARPVALADRTAEASFSIALTKPDALPGLHSFVCQHHTPDVTWREDFLEQPNTSQKLSGLDGTAPGLETLAAAWSRVLGKAVDVTDEALTATTATSTVRYTTGGAGPTLNMLRFAVADLGAAKTNLAAGDVPFEERADGIFVPNEIGFGASVLFHTQA